MAGWLSLDLDTEQLDQIKLDLMATDAEVQKALRTTFTKMARWVRTRSALGLSRELEVKAAIIRRRIKTSMVRGGGGLRVWYGLDPISLKELNPRQTREGVTAGKHKRPGAFLSERLGGHVFKREGKGRLPIKKQTLDIKDRADVFIEDEILGTDAFDAQFWRTFEHELAWRIQQRQ